MSDHEGQTSVVTRGSRAQFAVGIALISIIPLLVFWYLYISGDLFEISRGAQSLLVVLLMAGIAACGYAILLKYPVNIVRLRGYLERVIGGELPEQVQLDKSEDDIAAVEHCLNLIINQLKERLELLQREKSDLQRQLYQAQKMESLGLMAAGAAHDFNNLLTGIMGGIGLLADHVPAQGEAQELIRELELTVKRASELTHQMLIYSGRGKFVMEDVDLSALVRDMQPLFRTSIGKNVEVRFDLGDHLPRIKADPTQKRQVIMNLVINASDAIGDRAGMITIRTRELSCRQEDFNGLVVSGTLPRGRCVCLEVIDTGCGIDREKCTKVFDPFFTTKKTGKGLGLAVVLGIVVAHKGAIVIDSELGKGTRFINLIPCGNS